MSAPKFYADAMLGKLARWMRVLGYDVEYDPVIDDDELIRRAKEEERVILTRDTLLVKRRSARRRSFFVDGDLVSAQLKAVVREFPPDDALLLTRCLRCNRTLTGIEKVSVEERVPPYVFRTQDSFSTCTRCGRVYWGATHLERMKEDLERLLKD